MLKYDFIKDGIRCLPDFFNPTDTRKLMNSALATRDLNDLFLTEKEFRREKKHKGVNPRPGRNLIEKLDSDFIFSHQKFQDEMIKVCGERWRVLDYKFVMGVPDKYIPDWLKLELDDRLVANLGAYVKEQHRDITYFRGIDFHQDIIDFPERNSDFITVYIYLDDVTENASPLYIFPGSQRLGAAVFPHKLNKLTDKTYQYENDYRDSMECDLLKLTGAGGTMFYWHCNILHGTQPHQDDETRISVRILVEKNMKTKTNCELDMANAKSLGSLSLFTAREDLDASGTAIRKGNIINKN